MTPDDFLRLLVREGFGWKDIHATTVIAPEPNVGVPAPHRLIASDPLVAASAHVELGLPLPRGTRFRLLNRLLARLTWLTTRHQYVFNRAVIEAIELQRRDVDIRLAELAVLFARVTKLESVSKVGMRAAAEQLPSE